MDDEVEAPLDDLEAMADMQDDDLGDAARTHAGNCGGASMGGNQRD